MLVWVVGKNGLVGQSVMNALFDAVGSLRSQADVTDPKALEEFYKEYKPTHIINCSAIVHVDKVEHEYANLAKKINVDGVENLAKVAKKNRAKLIHISTDYVFDGEKEEAYSEEDQKKAVNVYGQTKLLGEQRLFDILPSAVCVRTASVYGYGKDGLIESMKHYLEENKRCLSPIDQVSTPTCSEDLATAILSLLDKEGVFHFVNKGFCSRFELLTFIKELMDTYQLPYACTHIEPVLQKDLKRAALRPCRSVLSTKKIEEVLKGPIRSWQEGVEEYFARRWGKGTRK
jgi:dTDP-4-dehydrorhamnose reductase